MPNRPKEPISGTISFENRLLPSLTDVRLYPFTNERADLLTHSELLVREQCTDVRKTEQFGRPRLWGPGAGSASRSSCLLRLDVGYDLCAEIRGVASA